MDLVLKVIDGPTDGEWRGLESRFDTSGGLIGRAETARLSLPDASRTVSRFHAHISHSDGTFFLEEMGSRNATAVNGKALAVGEKAPLRPGDQLRIGHFTLAVAFDDPAFPVTQIFERPAAPVVARGKANGSAAVDAVQDDGTRVVHRGFSLPAGGAGSVGLWEAFLDGAGVTLNVSDTRRPELMRAVGLMLRTLIGGMNRLVSQRVRLRDETSPEKARPQSRMVDPVRQAAEEARLIAGMLEPIAVGGVAPTARVQEMLEDLAARIQAMRTAVDVAVEQTEARLAPAAVEEKLQASLFLDELLPMRRKARLWDLYRTTHSAGVEPAAPAAGNGEAPRPKGGNGKGKGAEPVPKPVARLGVREAFNKAFNRAYDAEVARLRKDRH
jgi:predicted component of type VI protein secretion system